jgi:hypothetical protein
LNISCQENRTASALIVVHPRPFCKRPVPAGVPPLWPKAVAPRKRPLDLNGGKACASADGLPVHGDVSTRAVRSEAVRVSWRQTTRKTRFLWRKFARKRQDVPRRHKTFGAPMPLTTKGTCHDDQFHDPLPAGRKPRGELRADPLRLSGGADDAPDLRPVGRSNSRRSRHRPGCNGLWPPAALVEPPAGLR